MTTCPEHGGDFVRDACEGANASGRFREGHLVGCGRLNVLIGCFNLVMTKRPITIRPPPKSRGSQIHR
jgi:hypothetical protein